MVLLEAQAVVIPGQNGCAAIKGQTVKVSEPEDVISFTRELPYTAFGCLRRPRSPADP